MFLVQVRPLTAHAVVAEQIQLFIKRKRNVFDHKLLLLMLILGLIVISIPLWAFLGGGLGPTRAGKVGRGWPSPPPNMENPSHFNSRRDSNSTSPLSTSARSCPAKASASCS